MIIIGVISMIAFATLLFVEPFIDVKSKTKNIQGIFFGSLIATFIGTNSGFIYSLYVLNEIAIVFLGTTVVIGILAFVLHFDGLVKAKK